MKILASNKKVSFDYHILEVFEAGIVLLGHEVKSLRLGQANLKGGYISFNNNKKGVPEAHLINCHIPLYKRAGKIDDYNPERPRKILLKKKELSYLMGKKMEKGLTVVPVKVYTKNSFIKLEIAVVKGKKLFDKREDIKKRDLDRQMRSLTKNKLRS
jgi:SsrA-binding protein